MDKTNFDLDADSAAIIFHKDMSTELILPKMEDNEDVSFDEHRNIFMAIAVAALLDDEDFRKLAQSKIETMFETAKIMMEADDEDVVV